MDQSDCYQGFSNLLIADCLDWTVTERPAAPPGVVMIISISISRTAWTAWRLGSHATNNDWPAWLLIIMLKCFTTKY